MSLSTLHAHRSPFVLVTSSSSALPCLLGSPPCLSSAASLSSPPPSSASSPATAMASPTTVYSDRHSLPRAPPPQRTLHPCPPQPTAHLCHGYGQQPPQQQPPQHQHHHHHHLPPQQPPQPQPLSGILADMVPARPKGVVRFPPFEDGQHPVAQKAVRDFRISPFGSIQEYCRHIPYMSNKKTFFDKTRREGFEVFQYVFKLPGEEKEYHVMWDYNIGLVRMTPFFRCCNYGKTAPAKMLNDNPGLRDITHSITGGAIVAQGYWMPYECARAMCATFCFHVAGALVPLFGPDFPAQCIPPHATEYERKVIDPALIAAATREAELVRRMMVAEGHDAGGSGSNGSGSIRNANRGNSSGRSGNRNEEPPLPLPPPPPSSSGPRGALPSPSPLPRHQHLRPSSSSSSSNNNNRPFAMPPPPPPPPPPPQFRPIRAAMPMLPPPVQIPVRSPVVAPSVSPDYTMPPPRRASAAEGFPPSPVEQISLPPMSYIASLPPLSPPGRPMSQPLLSRDELLWHQGQYQGQQDHQEQQHIGYHHRHHHHHHQHRYYDTASRAPSPLSPMARQGREQEEQQPHQPHQLLHRDDRHRQSLPYSPLSSSSSSFAFAVPLGHALGRPPQEARPPSNSYPSPPQLLSALQQAPPAAEARDDNDDDDDDDRGNDRSCAYGSHDDRKHRRDSSGHGGSRHRKRPSHAVSRNESGGSGSNSSNSSSRGSSRRPPSPSLPRRGGGGSMAAPGRHRLPGRRPEGLPLAAAAPATTSQHGPQGQSTATDTAAAALLVNFSAKVRSRSGSGSGDEDDAVATRPRARAHTIASLLCPDEDN